MISQKVSQSDFINPDCTHRIYKGLQTIVFPYIAVCQWPALSLKCCTESSVRGWGRGLTIPLFGLKFIKILDFKRIQEKIEIEFRRKKGKIRNLF